MKISLNWLQTFIHLPENAEQIGQWLTGTGLEVEGIERIEAVPGSLNGLVVGTVLTCEQHPNADKLKVTTVDIGQETPKHIVCGAPNVAAGQKVIVAPVNTIIHPLAGEPFKIKKAKIRGELSEGMICAEDEIGLGHDHDGIIVLDTDAPNGSPAKDLYDLKDDYVFEIGLTPNRADAASHFGVARDLKALLKREVCLPSIENFTASSRPSSIGVSIEAQDACPRYSGIVVNDITVGDSPAWLQTNLKAIGLNPINNVVDVTNYILHGLGQPLHAFDAATLAGGQIVVKMAEQGQVFVTLDGQERTLQGHELMICDAAKPVAIAGVFGGQHSGVTAQTKRIFIESAYFNPASVRKSAQTHGLKTDASFRYERGTDPNITVFAAQLAALLIADLAGGKIEEALVDEYPAPIAPFSFTVSYARINQLIGKDLPKEEVQSTLTALDIAITPQNNDLFTVTVPPYRVDVTREADIVEEVLRIHGFDNVALEETLDTDFLSDFPKTDAFGKEREVASLLVANGFYEIMTNSLTKPSYAGQTDGFDGAHSVEILNKLSEELGVMRQSLLFTGLESVAHNINHRQPDLKFFEFGKTYSKGSSGREEHEWLSLFVTGLQEAEHWQSGQEQVIFQDLKEAVVKVLHKLGLHTFEQAPTTAGGFAYALQVSHQEKPVATLGLVHPKVLSQLQIKQPVFYAELNWQAILDLHSNALVYKAVSKYPEVRRDLSLVLDQNITFAQVKKVAETQRLAILQFIGLFDVYEGDKLEAGKKAYALKFVLQDTAKTLTDKVIDKAMNKLIKAFEQDLNAVIRK